MKRLLQAGLLLVVSTAAWAQDGLPCRHPKTGQDLPQVLGPGFLRLSTHGYESATPGAGCSVRYKHPSGMWADVYIYRAELGVIEDLPRDPRLLSEFQQVMDGIVQGWKQHRGGTVRDAVGKYMERGRARVEVMAGSAVIDVPNALTYRTHVLLWSGGGSIWKLRATFLDTDRAASDPAVEVLGDALVDLSREDAL